MPPPVDHEALRRTLQVRGQVVATGHDLLYVAFDGKVFLDDGEFIKEVGDYFEFVANLRHKQVPNAVEADNLITNEANRLELASNTGNGFPTW